MAGATKSGVVLTMSMNAVESEVLSKLQTAGTRKVTIVGETGVVSQAVSASTTAEAANASGNVLPVATNTFCIFNLPLAFMFSYTLKAVS